MNQGHFVTYRSRGLRTGMLVIGFLFPFFIMASALEDGRWGTELAFDLLVAAAGAVFFIFRLAQTRAEASSQGLRIINPLRTIELRWNEIERFECGRFGLIRKLGARRTDGTVVPIYALPVSGVGMGPLEENALRDLNSRLGGS